MTKISIGIPTYNRTEGLLRSVKSVLKQSFKDFEIIISNDNSDDNETNLQLMQLSNSDPRIKYFIQDSRLGMLNNYLFTLNNSAAKYFIWLSDDDEFLNVDFLEKLYNQIDKGYDFVFPSIKKYYFNKKKKQVFLSDRAVDVFVENRYVAHKRFIIKGYIGYQVMYALHDKKKLIENINLFANSSLSDEGPITHFFISRFNWYNLKDVIYLKDMTNSNLFKSSFKKIISENLIHYWSSIGIISTSNYSFRQKTYLIMLYFLRTNYIILSSFLNKLRIF